MDEEFVGKSRSPTHRLRLALNLAYNFLIRCSQTGETEWEPTAAPSHQFIFQIQRPEVYATAMSAVVRGLLSQIR